MIELPFFLKQYKDSILFSMRYLHTNSAFEKARDLLRFYHNKFVGDRVFIVGTGPSLNHTNLVLLKKEIVFGVNSLYKCFDGSDFYAVSDGSVWKAHEEAIRDLKCLVFLSSDAAISYVSQGLYQENIVPLRTCGYMSVSGEFSCDPASYVVGGHTVVTDICLQLVFWMGFSDVYLLGCDYSNLGTHWDGSESENKRAIGLIDPCRFISSFNVCRDAFRDAGRSIVNCTPGSALDMFPKMKLEDVL